MRNQSFFTLFTALTSVGFAASALAQSTPSMVAPTVATPTTTASDIQAPKVPDISARNEIIYRTNLGRADDVQLLINQGGSANQQNSDGVPLLSLASARNDAEGTNIATVLIRQGADVNARDRKGQTALFYAVKSGNIATLNVLLESRIDLDIADNEGNTARTFAHNTGHKEMVQAIDTFISKPVMPTLPPLAATSVATATATPVAASPTIEQQEKSDREKEIAKELEELKKNAPTREEVQKLSEQLAETNKKLMEQSSKQEATETQKATAEEKEQAEEEKQKAIERLLSDLALHTCAFQYWHFCSDVKQSTELSSEEMTVTIATRKAKVHDIEMTLIKKYKLKEDAFSPVVDSAQQRIYNQLSQMYSNAERHENGVGHMDDMLERCGEISRQWSVEPPGIEGKSKTDSGGGSNKNGGSPADHNKSRSRGTPTDMNDPSATPQPMHKQRKVDPKLIENTRSHDPDAVPDLGTKNGQVQPPMQGTGGDIFK